MRDRTRVVDRTANRSRAPVTAPERSIIVEDLEMKRESLRTRLETGYETITSIMKDEPNHPEIERYMDGWIKILREYEATSKEVFEILGMPLGDT